MKTSEVYTLVTNKIIALLESHQNLKYKQKWFELENGWPINVSTKKGYRGINIFLLTLEMMEKHYNLNRWLSLKQANELGGKIRKGEKSTPVVFYKKSFIDKDGKKYGVGAVEEMKPAQREALQLKAISFLNVYNAFNVAQVEGLPSECYLQTELQQLTEFEKDERAELLLRESGANIIYGGNEALYSFTRDCIYLPDRRQFEGAVQFYDTAFHELAHWTGHKTRLDRRDPNAEDKKQDYAMEELTAELTTAFVCGAIGFSTEITNNAGYIKGWIERLKADDRVIFKVFSNAQKAADLIMRPILQPSQHTT